MKKSFFLLLILPLSSQPQAQPANCMLKPPRITIHFGTGNIQDLNSLASYNYERVASYCPTDGHYTYTSYTSECFRNDWFTLTEDHTPGDANGNMMLVNASDRSGPFFSTTINGLKSGTTYEFAAWMMNVCRISDKCPFPLLPSISVRLETVDGKFVAQFHAGDLSRREAPVWTQYRAVFTTPPFQTPLILTMIDNSPGGCGNDFALDDITFRECVKTIPLVTTAPKPVGVVKKQLVAPKPIVRKVIRKPEKKQTEIVEIVRPHKDSSVPSAPIVRLVPSVFPARPTVLTTRVNPLIKQIETEPGDIRLELYDNGDIDGDTVSVYHNNELLIANAGLSQKPITFRIVIDAQHPHHEFIMVANNLGSIPPNTSLMVVTANSKRYEVFISTTEQKNAKIVLDLRK
jgi:hypothetical protein